MVINGSELDKIDISLEGETIAHCNKYTYLGAVIHEEATFTQFMEDHVAEKSKHVMKLFSFLNKNFDLPYKIKSRVLEYYSIGRRRVRQTHCISQRKAVQVFQQADKQQNAYGR